MYIMRVNKEKEMTMNNGSMATEIDALIENIKTDYFNWTTGCAAAAGRVPNTSRSSLKAVVFGVLLSTLTMTRSSRRVTF
jgi:hypothetical protein